MQRISIFLAHILLILYCDEGYAQDTADKRNFVDDMSIELLSTPYEIDLRDAAVFTYYECPYLLVDTVAILLDTTINEDCPFVLSISDKIIAEDIIASLNDYILLKDDDKIAIIRQNGTPDNLLTLSTSNYSLMCLNKDILYFAAVQNEHFELYKYDINRKELTKLLESPNRINSAFGDGNISYIAVGSSIYQINNENFEEIFSAPSPINTIAFTNAGIMYATDFIVGIISFYNVNTEILSTGAQKILSLGPVVYLVLYDGTFVRLSNVIYNQPDFDGNEDIPSNSSTENEEDPGSNADVTSQPNQPLLPDGMQKITYTEPTLIITEFDEKYEAQAGDYFVGEIKNGKIVQGRLYDKTGKSKKLFMKRKVN